MAVRLSARHSFSFWVSRLDAFDDYDVGKIPPAPEKFSYH
jgi:hypothetical protein